MTLRQLEVFSTIVESGSFTKTAEKLHVAQPSISQQMQQLEEELGAKLLFRTRNKKMVLTEVGKVVKEHADHILRQSEILRMEVASLIQEPTGEIYIGIGGHQLTSMVAPVLSTFHRQFPKIRVDIKNATSPQVIDLLKSNNLDLGIVTMPTSDPKLRTQVLFSEEMVLVVKKTHPWGSRRYILPAEIGQIPLVLYDRSTSTRVRLDNFFRTEGVSPQVALELSSVEAMEMMVEAGFGATIIPASAARALPYCNSLHALKIRGKPLTREVGVALPWSSRLPTVIDVMLRLIQEHFRGVSMARA